MMNFNPALKDQALDIFQDRQSAKNLVEKAGQVKAVHLSASRIMAYINGLEDEGVREALATDLSVRRVYKSIVKAQSRFHIPQAIAASSEEYPERHVAGCSVRLQTSKAQSDQLYLIIEFSDKKGDMPKKLVCVGSDETLADLDLPVGRNGVIQTIIETSSQLAKLLADPKTEIYLR